ncbi:hypothetical protein HK101_004927, partial [Irineochytrium annulatum]
MEPPASGHCTQWCEFHMMAGSLHRIYCSLHDPDYAKRVTLVKQPSALRRSNRLNASVDDSSGKTPTPAVAATIPALKPAVAGPKPVAAAPKPAMARRKKIEAPPLITVAEEGQDVNRAGQTHLRSVSTLLKEKLVKLRKSIGSQPDEGLQWEVASTKLTGRTSATEGPRFVAPRAVWNATPPTKNASAVKDQAAKSAPKAAPKAPKTQSLLPKLVGGEARRLAKGKAPKIASGAQKLGRDKDDKTGHDWDALDEEAILPGPSTGRGTYQHMTEKPSASRTSGVKRRKIIEISDDEEKEERPPVTVMKSGKEAVAVKDKLQGRANIAAVNGWGKLSEAERAPYLARAEAANNGDQGKMTETDQMVITDRFVKSAATFEKMA